MLNVAGARYGWLYLNGKLRADPCIGKGPITKGPFTLNHGDVIAIKMENDDGSSPHLFYGLALWMLNQRKMIATGVDEWRAIKISEVSSGDYTSRSFNSCSWSKAVVLSNAVQNFAGKTPSPHTLGGGAKYIWAKDAGDIDTVLFRHVVGGENCP